MRAAAGELLVATAPAAPPAAEAPVVRSAAGELLAALLLLGSGASFVLSLDILDVSGSAWKRKDGLGTTLVIDSTNVTF